jgi:PAS domain S-box-containing protein
MSDVIKKSKFSHGDQTDAEARIHSLSRSLDVLAEINKAILRKRNIPDLYDKACRIAVELGDFERAYISLIEPTTGLLQPVAYANVSPTYLETLKRVGATSPETSPFRKLLETGQYVYSNDIEVDPAMQQWRNDVRQSGCRSWASLPLIVNNILRGVFTLFAREPNYFGEVELQLVNEMASDISFAMAYAEQSVQLARHTADLEQSVVELNRAQAVIAESHARFRSIVDDQLDLVCRYDTNLNLTFVNAAYSKNHATAPDQLIGTNVLDLIPQEDRERALRHVSKLTPQNPIAISEHQTLMPDGTRRWFQWTDRALLDENGRIVEYQGVGRDISERRRISEAERQQRHMTEALHNSLKALTSSLDVDTVMNKILEQAARVFSYDAASITLFEGGHVNVRYNRGFSPETLVKLTAFLNSLPSNDYFVNIRNGDPYLVHDAHTARGWVVLDGLEWVRSSLGVPITIRGEIVGVLSLDSRQIGNYSAADIEPMKTFAGYAGLALENAYHAAYLEQSVVDRTSELRREKERVEAILNNSVDGILLAENDMRIKQENRAFSQLFACDSEEYIGKSLIDLVIPEHAAKVENLVNAALMESIAKTGEFIARRKDGSRFDAELSIGHTATKDTNHHGMVCTIHDISLLKERERQLRFHASLQENVTDAVIATTLDFRIQSWNRAAELMFGWLASEVIGRHIDDVLPLDTDRLQQMRREFRTQNNWSGEVSQQRRDGRRIYVQVSLVIFRDEYGQPLGVVSVNRDITLRVQAEQALQAKNAEERELQNYLKQLHDISIELTQIDDLDRFYRRAVELAMEKFNFDRVALMLYDSQSSMAVGTYGADCDGCLISEHGMLFDPAGYTQILLRAFQQSGRFCYDEDVPLYLAGEIIGRGWNAAAVMWNGSQTLGWITADNAVSQQPATKGQLEILGLYGSTVGAILGQKQVESALRKSEQRFRLLLEAAPIAIVTSDYSGNVTLVNHEAQSLFGYDAEELIGQKIEMLMPEQKRAKHIEDRDGFIANPHHRPMGTDQLVYAARKDGSLFPAQIELSHIDTDAGMLVMSFIVDITERLQAAAALEQQRVFLRRVIDVSPSMIYVKAFDGRYVLVNPMFASLYGMTPDELIGKSYADLNPSDPNIGAVIDADRRVIASEETIYLEEAVPQPNGVVHWFQTTKVPIVGEDGSSRYVLGVSTEITARRQAEEALRQSLAKETELGELKSRFVSIASHEFRTPLASILAATETLSAYRQNMADDQVEQRLIKIREQVDHLTDIMDDVLQLARIQARRVQFNPIQLDVDALCRDILDEFQTQQGFKHQIIYMRQSNIPTPKLDKKLMRQVITNLVSNAIKYSSDKEPIRITLNYEAPMLRLEVKDEGIGIPEADLQHLFEPFHRGQNVGTIAGTGLGLAIIWESVSLHGGRIEVQSELGEGATFTVIIPVTANQEG